MIAPKFTKREMARLIEIGKGGDDLHSAPQTTDRLVSLGLAEFKMRVASYKKYVVLTDAGRELLKGLPDA